MLLEDLRIEDQCMVHRYLYYVLSTSIISDYEYDQLERRAVEIADINHPINLPGSSNKIEYSERIIMVAENVLAS